MPRYNGSSAGDISVMVKKLRSTFDLMWCKFCDYQAQSGKECPVMLRATGCKDCNWRGCGKCDRPEFAHLEAEPQDQGSTRQSLKRKRQTPPNFTALLQQN